MHNAFLEVLRASFEGIYRRAAERGERTALLVPCSECLEGESFGQVFAETHVLQASLVPGCYMNLLGQGVEVTDTTVSTHLGFQESRICEILQSDSMYDFGHTFRVFVIDKPLVGRFRSLTGAIDRGSTKAAESKSKVPGPGRPVTTSTENTGSDWLNGAPAIQDDFFDQVDRFRKTFVQVPGCEQSTAERIREIVGDACKRLIRHHKLNQPSQLRHLDYQVSRQAYAALHSFVFPHLQRILSSPEERLEEAIRSYGSVAELVEAIPGAAVRGLGRVDVRECSKQLALLDHRITPHEKVQCIEEAHSLLQRCVAEGAREAALPTSPLGSPGRPRVEITGDDVLSLFILAVHGSQLHSRLAHVAHVEMYLQGAAGRSGSSEAARFEEAGYAVSALQAGLQFFLEERRQTNTTKGHVSRTTTNVISSFLSGPGDDSEAAAMHLQGLVRQARAQGQGRL